jgi:hypothetical protein
MPAATSESSPLADIVHWFVRSVPIGDIALPRSQKQETALAHAVGNKVEPRIVAVIFFKSGANYEGMGGLLHVKPKAE